MKVIVTNKQLQLIREISDKDFFCEKCDHSWEIDKDDAHPYLCHMCGYESSKNEYNYEELEKFWKNYKKEDLPAHTDPSKQIVSPSSKVISDICEKEKFCKKQGPITFGQLRSIIESAQKKNLAFDVGEGVYKALLRLFPWFFPQIAIAGFIGSSVRAFNKIVRPGLEDTTGYKSWWGKTIMAIMDTVEGELPLGDPISKIFFISDGLLHMMDRKHKLKFTRYIADVAASKDDTEPVPEFFVENELRNWVNQKFLLDPPLPPKISTKPDEELFENYIKEELTEKWSEKYKKSINCSNPEGFSQKTHCQGRKKKLKESKNDPPGYDIDKIKEALLIASKLSTTFGEGIPLEFKLYGYNYKPSEYTMNWMYLYVDVNSKDGVYEAMSDVWYDISNNILELFSMVGIRDEGYSKPNYDFRFNKRPRYDIKKVNIVTESEEELKKNGYDIKGIKLALNAMSELSNTYSDQVPLTFSLETYELKSSELRSKPILQLYINVETEDGELYEITQRNRHDISVELLGMLEMFGLYNDEKMSPYYNFHFNKKSSYNFI